LFSATFSLIRLSKITVAAVLTDCRTLPNFAIPDKMTSSDAYVLTSGFLLQPEDGGGFRDMAFADFYR